MGRAEDQHPRAEDQQPREHQAPRAEHHDPSDLKMIFESLNLMRDALSSMNSENENNFKIMNKMNKTIQAETEIMQEESKATCSLPPPRLPRVRRPPPALPQGRSAGLSLQLPPPVLRPLPSPTPRPTLSLEPRP